jgi:hypothetical protein
MLRRRRRRSLRRKRRSLMGGERTHDVPQPPNTLKSTGLLLTRERKMRRRSPSLRMTRVRDLGDDGRIQPDPLRDTIETQIYVFIRL